MALRSVELSQGERLYWLRTQCAVDDAVRVSAWWNKDVLVCPDAYRPDVKGDTEGRTCGASMLSPRDSDVCGCGAHLMFCTRGENHYQDLQDAIQQEVWETTAYVVNNDLIGSPSMKAPRTES